MNTVVILNIIVVFFAYLARYKNCEFFLKISFFLIFLFLALRYDYGNDYLNYLYTFLDAKNHLEFDSSSQYLGTTAYFSFEPGWLALYEVFQNLGFFAFQSFLAALTCFVYYFFIQKHVSPTYYWLAVFLYVFDFGNMLIHSSAMRQSLAICLFLISIDYIYKKKAFQYFSCVIFASLFHTSALLLLPIYFINSVDWKINNKMAIILFTAYFLLFVFGESIKPIISTIITFQFERYEIYNEEGETGTGLNLLHDTTLFLLILFYASFQNKENSLLFKIGMLTYFVKPVALIIMLIIRVEMYFNPILICVFPIAISTIKNNYIRNIWLFYIVFIKLYLFYRFSQNDVWVEAFANYHTIFSAPDLY